MGLVRVAKTLSVESHGSVIYLICQHTNLAAVQYLREGPNLNLFDYCICMFK